MLRTGELIRLWSVASQTDLTFNLVSPGFQRNFSREAWTFCVRACGT
jgi:hypothetical protein